MVEGRSSLASERATVMPWPMSDPDSGTSPSSSATREAKSNVPAWIDRNEELAQPCTPRMSMAYHDVPAMAQVSPREATPGAAGGTVVTTENS